MVDSKIVQDKNKNYDLKSHEIEDKAADFETAAAAAGFGLYNVLLLLAAIPGAISPIFKTSVMSYVVPSAECDLKLTLLDKGFLNAITYAGMITGGFFWGYISDKKGRKNILILGYAMDTICVLCEALSQNIMQLEIFQFVGGFIMCGPFAIIMTYMMEIHGKLHRPKVMLAIGMMVSSGTLILPLMALLTLIQKYEIIIFGLTVHPWNCFIALSAIPNVLGGIFLSFFPESPKFLLSQGKNEEALKVFQKIYSINHNKPEEDFPVKELLNDLTDKPKITDPESANNEKATSINGLRQFRPLFTKPYLTISLLLYVSNFCILLSQNSIRLWLPQLFASIAEYQELFPQNQPNMCDVLEYSVNKSEVMTLNYNDEKIECISVMSFDAYLNNIYVSLASLLAFLIAGSLVNLLGRKFILLATLFLAMISNICLYFSTSGLMTLIASCIAVGCGSLACTSLLDIAASSVATTLRAMIISIAMIIGRVGALSGNLVFPAALKLNCATPFTINAVLFLIGFILTLCFPKGTQKTSM